MNVLLSKHLNFNERRRAAIQRRRARARLMARLDRIVLKEELGI